jgi:hypothetical protein
MAGFVLVTIPGYTFGAGEQTGPPSQRADLMAKQPTAKARPRTAPPRGRPPVHQETWSKVSVVLFDRQIVHLDRLATGIRGRTGKVLNRAEIIRALIDGLIDSGMDISGTGSEADLRARVARGLSVPVR